jgi:hypothetical protein
LSDDHFIEQAKSCIREIQLNCLCGKTQKVAIRLEELFDLASHASAADEDAIRSMISKLADEVAKAQNS